jgi:hypothetical protein
MKRTTVYFPEELKARREEEAERRGVSEAELIRTSVDNELHRRAPRGGFLRGAPDDGVTGVLYSFFVAEIDYFVLRRFRPSAE